LKSASRKIRKLMPKELILVADKVLIEPDDGEGKTDAGLYLPQNVREKERVQAGRIAKIGPGYPVPDPTALDNEPWAKASKDKYFPLQANVGDYCIFLRDQGIEIYSWSQAEVDKMRKAIETELGITVSAGVSLSKVLAKIGSKHNKPNGLTVIPGRDIHLYLEKLPVEKVWGIGPNTAAFLRKHGITTALQFAKKEEGFVKKYLSKPYQEIWHELNGRSVYPVTTESKSSYQSISKARTFTPPSMDEGFVFAQLSKNLENACIKARRYRLAAARIIVFLRKQDFHPIFENAPDLLEKFWAKFRNSLNSDLEIFWPVFISPSISFNSGLVKGSRISMVH